MRHVGKIVVLLAILIVPLVGCTGFQERAQEVATRMENAEQSATSALAAAAENRSRIEDLEDRIAVLEAEIATLQAELGAEPIQGNE